MNEAEIVEDTLPEGAELVLNTDDFVDEATTLPEPKKQAPGAFLSVEKFLGLLRHMVVTEQITKRQAREMRQKFGITNNYFTKPKVDAVKKAKRKAIANASRLRNLDTACTKGQKRHHG